MSSGRVIAGRYELTEPLGKGAMGQVWGGRDRGLGGRRIAVKLMHSGRMASVAGTADPEELRRRFERECKVTAQLDHPGLVTVHDAGSDDDELFLVMQRVEGSDLSDHLAEQEPYPWPWAAAVVAQMSAALVALHAVDIVHRDLKPGNAIVRPDGRVVILDLGIASVTATGDSTRLTRTGHLIGTPLYMAPEQAMGNAPVGPAADLYALGVLLYELLTGTLPFRAPQASGLLYKKLHELPVPVRQLDPEVPEPLAALTWRLLDKEPSARPADAQEVYAALAPHLPRPGDPPARPGPVPMDPSRPFHEPMAPWPPRARRADPRAASRPVPEAAARAPEPWLLPSPSAATTPPRVPRPSSSAPPSPPRSSSAPAGFGPPPALDLPATLEEVRRLLDAGRYTQVADLLGDALPAAAAEHGEASPVVRSLRKQYAATLVDTAQYARALPEIRRLLRELEAEHGPGDPAVVQLREDEALCLRHSSDRG